MDAQDFARLASLVAGERSTVAYALARFRSHHIGDGWLGLSRKQAEVSYDEAIRTIMSALDALDDAEREARHLWREALATTHLLGV